MAGATCLEAMARTIEDAIVPLILPFVTQVTHTHIHTYIHTAHSHMHMHMQTHTTHTYTHTRLSMYTQPARKSLHTYAAYLVPA